MIVYADILLLVNFSMDFLTLSFTGRLLHKPLEKSRLTAAAAAGSVGGTVRTILVEHPSQAGSALLGYLLAVLMTMIAYRGERKSSRLIRDSFAVWGSGIFLSGIMTYILSLGDVFGTSESAELSVFASVFALSCILSQTVVRKITHIAKRKYTDVCICAAGAERTITVLCDSGSFASDPLSGLPVIIVRKGILTEAEKELKEENTSLKIRVIPLRGIGGESIGIGFIPERLIVDGIEKSAVVMIKDESGGFADCDGILPAALC